MTEVPEPERITVRIPKAALEAFAAAVQVGVAATVKDDNGLDWYYPLGKRDEDHVEFALVPGGEEVLLRMSSDRARTIVWSIEQWNDLVGRISLPGRLE
ncbi:hypothetical protein [Streptomyces graminilatus]|uniref:hypothetical protein n=1 Tax=Streptomyces graminilatus TaxID=1464070 RepID=UPI0006E38D0E|nr:hypothetical protein [Streptomyces graminilatus]